MATWATAGAKMTAHEPSLLYGDTGIEWTVAGAIEPIVIMPSADDVRDGVAFDLYGRSEGTLVVTGGSSGGAAWS